MNIRTINDQVHNYWKPKSLYFKIIYPFNLTRCGMGRESIFYFMKFGEWMPNREFKETTDPVTCSTCLRLGDEK